EPRQLLPRVVVTAREVLAAGHCKLHRPIVGRRSRCRHPWCSWGESLASALVDESIEIRGARDKARYLHLDGVVVRRRGEQIFLLDDERLKIDVGGDLARDPQVTRRGFVRDACPQDHAIGTWIARGDRLGEVPLPV